MGTTPAAAVVPVPAATGCAVFAFVAFVAVEFVAALFAAVTGLPIAAFASVVCPKTPSSCNRNNAVFLSTVR